MNNLDNHISAEDINSLALDLSDEATDRLHLDDEDEQILFDLVVNLLEKFCQYPDYRHYN